MSWKIGQEILKKLNESSLSRKEFAEKISKSRSNIYAIFEKEHISTDELTLISKVLGYNFFAHYYEALNHLPPTPPESEIKEAQVKIEELEKRNHVLEMENEYLKRINKLLEKEA